ncbi:hypothetical protein [Nonomuraea aridisoli]|uniref:Uncharacterized protein n=1 Tax=Nonomuraea aridisoli TaxID=2070368 RepID=A0A2W2DDZ2_9ACTN|nr:hypothetical protein [Nonomuraea aridisoli]PZG10082.1 hypothetical protein C1J01_36735 [Nonomuraea aridisoli]
MTRLRQAMKELAEEAPPVDLAEAAIARHRRGRRARLAVAGASVVTALGAGVVTAAVGGVALWPRAPQPAAQQEVGTVRDLPGGAVGAISHAYLSPCEPSPPDCGGAEWRVVTRGGAVYRVGQALVSTGKALRVPVAISRNGHALAYYDSEAGAHVVRDLVTGAEMTSPVAIAEERIGAGSQLLLSDDARYLAFDPHVGGKDRHVRTDLWLRPFAGGGEEVRFDGTFIWFSELAPDGRTVAAVEHMDLPKPALTLLDATTGRRLRELPVAGLPADARLVGTGVWRGPGEVEILVSSRQRSYSYAVDARTGRARQVAVYPQEMQFSTLTLPGVFRR